MSKINELSMDIQELLNRGYSYNTIAQILEIPVSWVSETVDQVQDFDQYVIDNDFMDDY